MRALEPGVHTITAADGGVLEFEIAGEGSNVIVALHGSFTVRRAFSRQVEPLVAAGFRLVMPSMRGSDGSGPDLPEGHGFASTELADLLTVLDAAGVEAGAVLGHSTGGTIAIALARAHPERVRAMVLIEPTLVALLPDDWRTDRLAAMQRVVDAGQREEGRPAMRATMDFIGGKAWDEMGPDNRERLLDKMAPFAHLAAPHVDQLARFAVTDADILAIDLPVTLLYGRYSPPFEAQIAARLAALRPDWPVQFVENVGHNVHREAPEVVNERTIGFLAR